MSKKRKNADKKGLERFFMEIAENADAAMREYWQERDGEHRLYAAEYVRRRGFLLEP